MAKAFNSINVYVGKTHIVGFGKHEGETWASVLYNYPNYIIWCVANMNSPPMFSREFIIEAIKLTEADRKAVRAAYKTPALPRDFEYAPNGGSEFDEWDIPF